MSGDAGDWVWEVEATATCGEHSSWALYASHTSACDAALAARRLIDGDVDEASWAVDFVGDHCVVWTHRDGQVVSLERVDVLP